MLDASRVEWPRLIRKASNNADGASGSKPVWNQIHSWEAAFRAICFVARRLCGLFPDGTPEKPKAWFCCCFKHDVVYWRGGRREERDKADQELEQCVAAVGYPNIGATMRLGVYAGGAPYWPTWFR